MSRLAMPFSWLSALIVGAAAAVVCAYLAAHFVPALQHDTAPFWTSRYFSASSQPPRYGIVALVWGSVLTSGLALLIAYPLSLAVALYCVVYAPGLRGRLLARLIDAVASMPSIVVGLWGLLFLVPRSVGVQTWLSRHLGAVPLLANPTGSTGRSVLAASVVLAVIITPLMASLAREAFGRHTELWGGALAIGATTWQAVRLVLLAGARPELRAARLLGLSRALAETVAVNLVLAASFTVDVEIVRGDGASTLADTIANQFQEADTNGLDALLASGAILLALNLGLHLVSALAARRQG
jgi:phosphate transport system permease protein